LATLSFYIYNSCVTSSVRIVVIAICFLSLNWKPECFQTKGIKTDIEHDWSHYGRSVCNIESGKFAVTLNRTAIFQTVVSSVLHLTTSFGSISPTVDAKPVVMINCIPTLKKSCYQDVTPTLSLSKLRLLVLGQHLHSMLLACR
jgi:hypothetical protein